LTKKIVYFYEMKKKANEQDEQEWVVTKSNLPDANTYFGDVPVSPYYFDDTMTGIIRPVIKLIDALDKLYSDSMNEFDRFAYAYLLLQEYNLVDPIKKKEPGVYAQALAMLKRYRVFENLKKDSKISFLTKDIPTEFIKLTGDLLRDQIHIQSHVPDFTNEKMSGASGIAIQRLVFDFENMVSSCEAEFDVGLNDRIKMITFALKALGRVEKDSELDTNTVIIIHKRNLPQNIDEFVTVAVKMKTAGFSAFAIASYMPDEVIPNVKIELARQKKEAEALMGEDIESALVDETISEEEDDDEEEEMKEE